MGCLFSRNPKPIKSLKDSYDLDAFDYTEFFENKNTESQDPKGVTNPLHNNHEIDYSQFFQYGNNFIQESYSKKRSFNESDSFHENKKRQITNLSNVDRNTSLMVSVLNPKKISVTNESNLIYPYKKTRWNISGITTEESGKQLHKEIEDFLISKKMPSLINNNFKQFLDYYKENVKEVLFVEKTVENNKYIGVIDAIIKNYSDEIILVDWKYTDRMDLIGYDFDEYFGYGISNYQRYSFQLNLYYHLCLYNNIKVNSIKIVQFTTNENYRIYPIGINNKYLEYFNGKINKFTVPDILKIPISFGRYKGQYIKEIPISYVVVLACYKIQNKKLYDNFECNFRNWLFSNAFLWIKISRMYLDKIKICLLCLNKEVSDGNFCLCINCYMKQKI